MKKYIVIGLGNFGINLSKSLIKNGCEVLGIDTSKYVVDTAKDFISHAIIGDASNKEVLEEIVTKDYDGAIVSIGQKMEQNILISLYLKELGIERIVSRAISDDHVKILNKLGISDIIFPEKDEAHRLGNRLALKNALDYLPMGEDFGIVEVSPPKSFIGKSLKELQIPSKFNCQVIGMKYNISTDDKINFDSINSGMEIVLSGDNIIKENSVMIIIGTYADIENLQKFK
jgi:trk system potassium uptake protein